MKISCERSSIIRLPTVNKLGAKLRSVLLDGPKSKRLRPERSSAHSTVIPSEGYTNLVTQEDRLREIVRLQQKAGLLESEIARRVEVETNLRYSVSRELVARNEAENANRMKDEFLATLSHELRTPLTPMLGWTQALRTGALNAENSRKAVDAIERGVQAQTKLIQDLLDVSKIITGKLQLELSFFSLESAVNAVVQILGPAAEAKNIAIDLSIQTGSELYIWVILVDCSKYSGISFPTPSNLLRPAE